MIDPAHRQFAQEAVPLNWYEVAKLVHESAEILHRAPQGTITYTANGRTKTRRATNRSVFLLAAFSLENLLKAFLVYENPQYVEGGKLSRALLNGHGLVVLQSACKKIPSPKRTRHVFETLEVGVNSWARYPCSTSVARESEERSVTPEFWQAYKSVFQLYSQRLEALLTKRWKGPYGEVSYATFSRH